MKLAGSFSVRVMAVECYSQMLFATFFSTRDFADVNLLAAGIHEKVFILRTRKHRRGAALH
jgi:hypothetical protein